MKKESVKKLKEKYNTIMIITIVLSIALALIIILFLVGMKIGWFGEPGKVYLSPGDVYVKCGSEDLGTQGICDKEEVCTEVVIKDNIDYLCVG